MQLDAVLQYCNMIVIILHLDKIYVLQIFPLFNAGAGTVYCQFTLDFDSFFAGIFSLFDPK